MSDDAHRVLVLHEDCLSVSKVLVTPKGAITKPILFEILAHSSTVVKQEDVKHKDEPAAETGARKVTKRALSKGADPSTPRAVQKVAAERASGDAAVEGTSSLSGTCTCVCGVTKARPGMRVNATPGPSNTRPVSRSPFEDLGLHISQSHYEEFLQRLNSLPTSIQGSVTEPESDDESVPAKKPRSE
ncbi:hypothetical protein EWM64_g4922 [Hericium alpestre]|uniref:Uncharacterized protein n=1 Tax=Hericium alpestre TaxID=135208 RepID=A0A4Y9ZYC4_9AGAM|nr:hypothetical protein EWM64_g4922 [Hericium alpestre]